MSVLSLILAALPLAAAPAGAQEEALRLSDAWRERLAFPPFALDDVGVIRFDLRDLDEDAWTPADQRVAQLRAELARRADDRELRLRLARALIDAGQREAAQAEFAELSRSLSLELDAGEGSWATTIFLGDVMSAYGLAFRNLGTLKRAESILHDALAHGPSWRASAALSELYFQQAVANQRDGRGDDLADALVHALEHAEAAVAAGPRELRAQRAHFLARWLEITTGGGSAERIVSAVSAVTRDLRAAAALATRPERVEAVAAALLTSVVATECAAREDPEAAFDALPEALRAQWPELLARLRGLERLPRRAESARRLAWLGARLARHEDEGELYETALRLCLRPASLIEYRLALEARCRRWQALPALAEQLVRARLDSRTFNLFARVAAGRGDIEQARADYRSSFEIDPAQGHAPAGIAIAMLKSGAQPEEVLELLRDALREEAVRPTALHALGVTLALLGRYDEALEALENARATLPAEERAAAARTAEEVAALAR